MRTRLVIVVALLLLASVPHAASASTTYLPVGDEVYPILDRLEAEGLVPSGLLDTRPISRAEAERLYREAEGNASTATPFIRSLLEALSRHLGARPMPERASVAGSAGIRVLRTDTNLPTLQHYNDGALSAKGINVTLNADLRVEQAGPFAFEIDPEYRETDGDDELVMRRGYAVLGISKVDAILGKESQWWGPGRHGSILLSNNAEPFTMALFTNPEPVELPWILRGLGPFRFVFFATQLEKNRTDVPSPYLWGMRFDFKPHPRLEIGLERTAILGGQKGRSDDLATWTKSIFPFHRSDNTGTLKDPGDQRAGFSAKWNLPIQRQPVQLYVEGDGEDLHILWPNLWAWVGGIYLPQIGPLERIDARFEIGTTAGRRLSPTVWYNHWIYTAGYTYKGQVIGHHIGTDSRDLSAEFSYHLPEITGRLFLAYDREEHHLREGDYKEIDHEVVTGADLYVSTHVAVAGGYSHAWVRNFANAYSPTTQINSVFGEVRYEF
ncbi:MAG: capsule assembly Wzi family protein [Nitrospiraceae bacterium]|nr:capsule assembly Wzi family protein [Nitrospiraceae bacterium]